MRRSLNSWWDSKEDSEKVLFLVKVAAASLLIGQGFFIGGAIWG
jgi:hypothetical protein